MKRWMLVVLMTLGLVLLAVPAFAGGGTESGGAKDGSKFTGEVYIGISAATTGNSPVEGEMMQKAILLAVEEANRKGGVQGREVKVVAYDDINESAGAINAVSRLAADKRVLGIIGPHRSANILAVSDIVKENKISIFTAGTTTTIWELNNPYIWRIRPVDGVSVSSCLSYLVDQRGMKKIGVMHQNDDFGQMSLNAALDWFSKRGMTPSDVQGINTGDRDFTAPLLHLRDSGSEAFIAYCHAPEFAVVARQYHELGMTNIPVLGNSTSGTKAFFLLVSDEVADGLQYTTDFIPDNPDPYVQQFVATYRNKYKEDPELFAGCYWDAAQVLLDALSRTKEFTREAVRDAIAAVDIRANLGRLYSNPKVHPSDLGHQLLICINDKKTAKLLSVVEESN
jgi:branched-chain amino acid transport system substrate-binding protein